MELEPWRSILERGGLDIWSKTHLGATCRSARAALLTLRGLAQRWEKSSPCLKMIQQVPSDELAYALLPEALRRRPVRRHENMLSTWQRCWRVCGKLAFAILNKHLVMVDLEKMMVVASSPGVQGRVTGIFKGPKVNVVKPDGTNVGYQVGLA